MVVCGRGGVVRFFFFSSVVVRERPQSSSSSGAASAFWSRPRAVTSIQRKPTPLLPAQPHTAGNPLIGNMADRTAIDKSASRHVPGAVPSRRPSGQCSSPPSVCDHPVRVPFVVLSCLRFIVLAC